MQEIEPTLIYLSQAGNLTFVCLVMLFYLVMETVLPLPINPGVPAIRRWLVNMSIHVVNSLVAYFLLFYLFGASVEEAAGEAGIGLFDWVAGAPLWVQWLVFTLLADFAFYWFHRAMHTWRPLWRVHIVHHSDLDVDFSDSFRIHPLQAMIEMVIRVSITLALGVPIIVLVIYDLLYTLFVFYPHSKIRVPRPLERVLGWVIVTSDIHRIHHSAERENTDSNYGDIFSFWDRLFGTYRFKDWDEQAKMKLGLGYFRDPKDQSLLGVLLQPFTYQPKRHQGDEPAPKAVLGLKQ